MEKLEKNILIAFSVFPSFPLRDPNLSDVITVAAVVYAGLEEDLSEVMLSVESEISIVELVESEFINGLIRSLPNEVVINRAKNLVTKISEQNLVDLSPEQALIISLSLWHGCISMAKTTRIEDAARNQYTTELRNQEYDALKSEWEKAEIAGNVWIKRGSAIARKFQKERIVRAGERIEEKMIEDWIPEESPFWQTS